MMNELKVNLTDAPLRCLRKAGLVRRRENAGSAGGVVKTAISLL
jgi:hypothetical protein